MKRLMLTALTTVFGTVALIAQIPGLHPSRFQGCGRQTGHHSKERGCREKTDTTETARKIRSAREREALVQTLTHLENDWVEALKTKNAEKFAVP